MGYVPSLALPWEEGALSHLRQCPTQPPRKPYGKLDSSCLVPLLTHSWGQPWIEGREHAFLSLGLLLRNMGPGEPS